MVDYAVQRRLAGTPDVWDLAAELELAVLTRAPGRAPTFALGGLLALNPIDWQHESTGQSIARIDKRASGTVSSTPRVLDMDGVLVPVEMFGEESAGASAPTTRRLMAI